MTLVPLERRSTVEALAEALRARILDGELAGGERLREQELSRAYDVARHTVRAALRALQAEGLVVIEPNRGARVATLDADAVRGLFELRMALETEAARLALERHPQGLPRQVRAAVRSLSAACARGRRGWSAVVEAHDAVHATLVEASESPRIVAAHRALAGEMRLFLVQLRPSWTLERMAADHERLVDELERRGPDAMRDHLRESAAAVLARLESG
ncbi:MAG TPA: GntR family transcriptional regulator [Solirubrobacteraceae bacterium]|nr:GntR family transcriptional regulator [Solirubrobacteraceae bacterium]